MPFMNASRSLTASVSAGFSSAFISTSRTGLRSIASKLGTNDFGRIRFGIGRPPGKMSVADWALRKLKGNFAEEFDLTCEDAATVVRQLVDIVSKNGCLLLSIPLRADGTYDEKEAEVLDGLEAWMTVNGESIFGTRPWQKFGEGPVADKDIAMNAQGFNDGQYAGMDWRDIRFNQTKKYLYATAMGWPEDGRLVIRSLAKGNTLLRKGISSVTLLGYGRLKARQTAEGLTVQLPAPTNKIAPVLRIAK